MQFGSRLQSILPLEENNQSLTCISKGVLQQSEQKLRGQVKKPKSCETYKSCNYKATLEVLGLRTLLLENSPHAIQTAAQINRLNHHKLLSRHLTSGLEGLTSLIPEED